MGITESSIKAITEPVNNLIGNCGHSDCKTKCGNCCELEIDTTSHAYSMPDVQPREGSRESMSSNITNIVELHEKPQLLYNE